MSKPPGKLRGRVVGIPSLSAADRARMFELMNSYYDAITEPQFQADLSRKTAVIVLRDRGARIQGFSTLLVGEGTDAGQPYVTIFSGDTVVDQAYWGERQLGKTFLRYLLAQKLRHPFRPVYWFLISKGYKTYLLMANNFGVHYPRFEAPTPPRFRAIMDRFYAGLYPDYYEPATGLIRFAEAPCKLKPGVAAVTRALSRTHPRVAFFESVNPAWQDGSELACLARMSLWLPLTYALKAIGKQLARRERPVLAADYEETQA